MAATCPSSSALAGTDGNVVVNSTRIARITQFSVNHSVQTTVWGDSDSAGYQNTKGTRKGATGAFEGKFSTDHVVYELFSPGEGVALNLFENATRAWVFPCVVITEFSMTVNVDSQEVVGWSASFSSDGIFYRPGDAANPGATLPAAPGP